MMARATQTAPTYAKSSTYDASVETCEREEFATFANVPICHHRGSKVPVGNHVSLYYPGFDDFVTDCQSIPIERADCEFVNSLCLSMAKTHNMEDDRVIEFEKHLRGYLQQSMTRSSAGSPVADLAIGLREACYGEVKKEVGAVGGDSFREGVSYFIGGMRKRKFDKCPAPSYIMELVGPNLIISGAVYGQCVYVDRLVAPVWLVCQQNNNIEMIRIARLMKALKKALALLDEYYKSVSIPQPRFPCFQHFDDSKIEYFEEIKAHVFRARAGEKKVVVKFAQTYSREVHELLASTPAILYWKNWAFHSGGNGRLDRICRQHSTILAGSPHGKR